MRTGLTSHQRHDRMNAYLSQPVSAAGKEFWARIHQQRLEREAAAKKEEVAR